MPVTRSMIKTGNHMKKPPPPSAQPKALRTVKVARTDESPRTPVFTSMINLSSNSSFSNLSFRSSKITVTPSATAVKRSDLIKKQQPQLFTPRTAKVKKIDETQRFTSMIDASSETSFIFKSDEIVNAGRQVIERYWKLVTERLENVKNRASESNESMTEDGPTSSDMTMYFDAKESFDSSSEDDDIGVNEDHQYDITMYEDLKNEEKLPELREGKTVPKWASESSFLINELYLQNPGLIQPLSKVNPTSLSDIDSAIFPMTGYNVPLFQRHS